MATIKDVAREASVSVATVSRVFNGAASVREETAKRIRDVAAALRYAPHGGARSLITRRTHTLGVLLPDLYGEFFSELIHGIDVTARREGYHILVSRSWEGRTEIEEAMRAMKGRVDGLLLMSPDVNAESLRNIPHDLPVVLIWKRKVTMYATRTRLTVFSTETIRAGPKRARKTSMQKR
jgi:LacI family transcriptional regulator